MKKFHTMGSKIQMMTSRGVQDQFLFAPPVLNDSAKPASMYGTNPFIHRYNRSMNFMSDHKELIFANQSQFGQSSYCIVPHHGAYLQQLYLRVRLPALIHSSGSSAAWTNAVGFAIIKDISLEIGGVVHGTLTGEILDILEETSIRSVQKDSYRRMVGKFDFLSYSQTGVDRFGLKEEEVIIPLRFWFTESIDRSIPVGAMASGDIIIRVTFNDFSKCVVYDGDTPPIFADILSASIVAKFHHVDAEYIETNMIGKSFLYLSDQIQTRNEHIPLNRTGFHVDLDFKHPVRCIYWMFIEEESENNNDWFNYNRRSDGLPIMTSASFELEGFQRSEMLTEKHYRIIQPLEHAHAGTEKAVYQYNFGQGEQYGNSPSGSVNFSRLDKASMYVNIRAGNPCRMFLFAVNWNVFITNKGLSSMMFHA